MKKAISLALCLCLLLCGCGSSTAGASSKENKEFPYETLPGGSYSYVNSTGSTIWNVKTIPFDMEWGGKTATLNSAKFFEIYANHGYTPYILVSVNREEFSDDDLYWMTSRDFSYKEELSFNVYFKNEANEYDDRLSSIGCYYDSSNLYYIFEGNLSRYSFIDSDVMLQIIHAPDGITNPTTSFYYDFSIDESNYYDDFGELDENELMVIKEEFLE